MVCAVHVNFPQTANVQMQQPQEAAGVPMESSALLVQSHASLPQLSRLDGWTHGGGVRRPGVLLYSTHPRLDAAGYGRLTSA